MTQAGGKVSGGARDSSLADEYERHRAAVLGTLAKRFPRFDDEERLGLYHDAWARVYAKRQRGEPIESLRAFLLATAGAEAMNAVSRRRPPVTVGPDDPLLSGLADDGLGVEEQVVIHDQARLARELIDSLDERQRDVLKLRWDVGLSPSEVRAALDLTPRQYQRLAEEGAAAITERLERLEDGSWSRRTRSLLAACLVRVTCAGEVREGIASAGQRRRAQRLLETDPHAAAIYAELRAATYAAAVLLPVPAFAAADGAFVAPFAELGATIRDRLDDLLGPLKHATTSLYVRAADPSLLAGPRPGAAVAATAGALALGGGAYGAYEQIKTSDPAPQPSQPELTAQPAHKPTPTPISAASTRPAQRPEPHRKAHRPRPPKPQPKSNAPNQQQTTPAPSQPSEAPPSSGIGVPGLAAGSAESPADLPDHSSRSTKPGNSEFSIEE